MRSQLTYGLVVFLRVLEYYQGIMFLTTNQIAQFDVAIPSRIHIALKYESLNKMQMEKIFRGFLDPLDAKGLVEDYEGVLEWLKDDVYTSKNFDGRQIRNTITSALALARDQSEFQRDGRGKLQKTHLKQVFGNVKTFNQDFLVQFDRYKRDQEKMIQ